MGRRREEKRDGGTIAVEDSLYARTTSSDKVPGRVRMCIREVSSTASGSHDAQSNFVIRQEDPSSPHFPAIGPRARRPHSRDSLSWLCTTSYRLSQA